MGAMPLVDDLVVPDRAGEPEARYPLTVAFCEGCSLVQILESLPARELFGEDYPYYSSYSDHLVAHAEQNVVDLIERHDLGSETLVVEPASNDGYLLQHFVARGVPVLGIDPAAGPAAAARRKGIDTIDGFLTLERAKQLRSSGMQASLVVANNVLAHVSDQNDFVAAIAELLVEDGAVAIEAPYVRDMIERCEYDTIYHEHHCYFSALSVSALLARHGLQLNDVEHLSIHGGSLRLHASFSPGQSARLEAMLAAERDTGMHLASFYEEFAGAARRHAAEVRQLLASLKRSGATIAAYGAAAKGAVLLNYAGIGRETIDFVVDRNPAKQGKFLPGVGIPILATDEVLAQMPDYLLILPWNFADEILEQQAPYLDAGGKAIVTNPAIKVL